MARDRGPRSFARSLVSAWSAPPRFAVIVTRRLRCATRTSVSAGRRMERPTASATSSTSQFAIAAAQHFEASAGPASRRFRSTKAARASRCAISRGPARPSRRPPPPRAPLLVPEPLLDVLRVGLVPQEFREPPRLPLVVLALLRLGAHLLDLLALRERRELLVVVDAALAHAPLEALLPQELPTNLLVGRLALLVEPVPHEAPHLLVAALHVAQELVAELRVPRRLGLRLARLLP